MKEHPFIGKPIAIQSASQGPLGGARMQYDLRKMLLYVDAVSLIKPEIFVTMAQTKFDEAGKLKDEPTITIIKQQLEAFEKFIAKMSGK